MNRAFLLVFLLALTCCSFAYELRLQKGWNLVGLPFASAAFGSDDCIYNKAWVYYDGSYITVDLTRNPLGMNFAGFFLYAKKDCSINVTDASLGASELTKDNLPSIWKDGGGSLNFKTGWNFVAGFKNSATASSVSGDCRIIDGPYYYDNSANAWKSSDRLDEGKGYAIKVASDCKFGYAAASTPQLPQLPK